MSDYIKREDAMEAVRCYMMQTGIAELPYTFARDEILKVPSADVVEVRHGYWKDGDEPIIPYEGHYSGNCSICGEWSEYLTDYCPNCGARMDGGGSDE